MNGEEELIPTNINPALRRFRTRATDDNRLSLAAINVDQASRNNSKLEDPTSNLHFFGCSRTRRQRNLKTGYRLGRAHEKSMSSDSDEEMNDLELLDSDDERIESHSESVDAESVEVQTGSVNFSTLSLEDNTSVNMNDNDNLSQSCETSEPQYGEKYESKIPTEPHSSGQLNSSEGSVMTNSLLNYDDQKMCADVPNMDPPSNDDRLESTLAQMCADVPKIDQHSIDDTLDSNLKQLELGYLWKLRRKKTVIEDDNRLAFYDCCVKKDKVFLQSNQNEQMNSESQETRVSSTSEPQMKNTSQENSRTAMESKTSKDLDAVQHYETRPELDQEHMAFLAKLRKIKTKFTDDNRLTLFFENDTVVQVIPNEDTSGLVPGLGRNSLVSKGQRSFVTDSVQNQPTSVDSKSNRSARSENINKKTTMSTKGKSSDKSNHCGPVKTLQSESAKENKMRRGVGNQDTKKAERKTPQTSLKSGPSANVPSAQNSSQGSAGQGKTSDVDNYEWYFKGINRAESEKILRDEGTNGCFMVRDSSMPGMYSLSLLYKARKRGQVKHYLIYKSMDDKFYLEKKQEFTTIHELVDYHKINVGGLITLLGNPPVRKNGDIVRTSTGFVSDSDNTSSEESLLSTDESQEDLILMGQDDKSLDPEDGEFYLEDSVWANVIETEGERCLTLNPLPIGGGRNTVLCIDISASMSGTAWDQLKTALDDFLEGLEENAKENGPEENIAIITFGHQTRVALTLTNDYIQVKNTLDQLYPDGVSPLSAGMALVVVPLACIQITRPMHVDLHGIHVYPRAVIFTDGKATPVGMISGNDECPEKNCDEVHAKLIEQCEKMWAEIKVEFVFVPIGDANRTILGTLAEGQNVKIEEYTNMKRLTRLSRNMELACQIGGHMLAGMKSSDKLDSFFFQSLVAAISPELTSQEMYDILEIVEMFLTQKNQEPQSSGNSLSEEQDTFEELRRDKLPPLGTRVRRGRNWKGGNHDSSGPGTITGHSKRDDNNVYVQWDNGFKYSYVFGSEIEVVDQPKPSTHGKLSVCVGCMVRRGPHWQWGNADGEPGALGTVYRVEHNNTVQVRWEKTGNKGNYRCGRDGMFDVIVCNPEDPYESKITEEVLNKRNRENEKEASNHVKVSRIGEKFQSTKRTETGAKDKKSISWYKEPIIHISQPTERNSDLEGTQESFSKMNETSNGEQILSVIGAQSSIKSEKLNPCEQNNENTSWEVKELQDISLEKEKTLNDGVVNESKFAETSVLTEDELRESNSMEKFENTAFFNDLEVNIDALETVQEPFMERNEISSGDPILSIIGAQSSIKSEKLNPCEQNNENTSWEVKRLQDILLQKEKTFKDRVVNESTSAEKSVSPHTHDDELRESNSMEKFENAAFHDNLEVNIGALETVRTPFMEKNETSSGDQILSIVGAQSSIKSEKLNPCEQNNENTSWKVKELQDISLEKEKTLNDGVVNESKFAETSVLTEDELRESNSMEKFENTAFFNDLEVNIDALETVQEPFMERNEISSGDPILSIIGAQSSIKSEKLNPCEQNNENTSWEVKELEDISLQKEKTFKDRVVNESTSAEKSVSPHTHDDELRESNSMEEFENAAFHDNLEVNIGALETVRTPFMEKNETSSGDQILSIIGTQSSIKSEKLNPCEQNNENTSWKVKELQDISLEKEKTLNDGVVNESKFAETSVLTEDELRESNSMEKFENTAFFNDLEVNIDALETVQEPFMERNEISSGDPILSIIGAQSSIKSEKLNPCEQNNENTSWEVKRLQDILLQKEKTFKDRVVNESTSAEKSVSPHTHDDELRESNSMEKFENAAFHDNLEVNIGALETVRTPFMEKNETSSGDQILSIVGAQSSIKSEKLNPCEQNNENTSWKVKELQDISLEKEKTLNDGVVNESKFAETSVLTEDELRESNSMEKFENTAFFNDLEVNIDALETVQEPFMERNEISSGDPILSIIGAQSSIKSEKLNPCEQNNENTSWEVKELEDISLQKEKTFKDRVVNESTSAEKSVSPHTHDDELRESNSMEEFENAAFHDNLEVNIGALETVRTPFMEKNETSSGDQILSIIGTQSSIKSEKLNPCEQNNENTSWKVKELQDISLEKEKTLNDGVVNESKFAETSVLTEDELRESNSMEKFENTAFFNDLEVNIDALETVQEPFMERNEISSGDPILSIIGAQSSIKSEKLNPCEQNNENTSWEVKELQDISLEKEKTLNGGVVNESIFAETSVLTEDELRESNSMEKFENTAFFNDLEVNIDALETVQTPFMEKNETSSGDQILSIVGAQSSIKSEKLNPCEQNNENTSWEVKELQDISLEKEKTLNDGVVNESKFAEMSVLTEDELRESNSMEKFENTAFFNDLEVNIDALETVQEPFMERNEISSGDPILSIIGAQSSIKSEKLNPCEQNNENTSWEVKELQDISLEKEKTLNGGVVNESKLAEKYVLPNTRDEELGESNSLEEFEHAAFFNNLEVNIDALETIQEPFMESNEASSGESDSLEKFEKSNFFNNLEGDISELRSGKDQNRYQINDESNNTEDKTSDTDEEKLPVLGIEISNQTERFIQDISLSDDNLVRKEQTVVRYQEDQIMIISSVNILSGEAEYLDYSKTNDLCEENYDTDSTIISEQSYSTDESQSSTSSSCADENLNYGDLNMQETSPSQTSSQLDSVQKWKLNACLEANQEQTGLQNSSEDGLFSSNLPMSSRTMSQESLFTQDSSYDWRGSMSELSDTSLCLGEGEVMPQWVWLNQDNMWEPFSRDTNMKLEKSFRRNPKSTTVVQIGGQLYRIIFSHMAQRNIETKETFKIQRHEISN